MYVEIRNLTVTLHKWEHSKRMFTKFRTAGWLLHLGVVYVRWDFHYIRNFRVGWLP